MDKYIFISYAHKDSDRVIPVIQTLRKNGFRVWYDDGIDPGTEWDKNIAEHIIDCSYFIAFISKSYLASANCRDEIAYARDENKKHFLIYIEDVELPKELKLRLSRIQNLFMHKYPDKNVFYQKLFAAEGMEVCRDAAYMKKEADIETATAKEAYATSAKTAPESYQYKKKSASRFSPLILILTIVILGGGVLFFTSRTDGDNSDDKRATSALPSDDLQTPQNDTTLPESSNTQNEATLPESSSTQNDATPPESSSTTMPEPTNAPTSTTAPTLTPESPGYTQGLSYKLNDAETYYIVTGIGSASDEVLIIPEEYNGLPVKEIANHAFSGLTNLTKLVIPKTIKKIGYGSFADTYNLAEIEYNAVECSDCSSYGVFPLSGQYCNDVRLTIGPDVTRIPSYLFSGGSNLKNYFNLSSVSFQGNKVAEIGEYAFYGCQNLLTLELPEGVRTIGMQAFDSLSGLNRLVIPSTVKQIGWNAFANTVSLTEIEYNAVDCSDLYSYGAFKAAGQDSQGIQLTIGSEVKYIPDYLFSNENSFLEDNRTKIASVTFAGTKVTEIGDYAFKDCINIKSLELPEGLKTIRNRAFENLSKLTTLVIPSTVKTIESQAFAETISLKEIKFNAVECSDCNYSGAFRSAGEDSDGITLTIGSEVTRIPAHLFDSGEPNDYTKITDIIFEGTKVTEIGDYAFKDCKSIPELELPEGIKTIGNQAFYNLNKLTKLVIPSTVKSIGSYAFYNTANLTEFEFNAIECSDCNSNGVFKVSGQSNSGIHLIVGAEVTRIPAYLFSAGNGGEELITRYHANVTSVSFEGTQVIEIGSNAFEGCIKLTSITFPKSLKTIKMNAFYQCYSLASATFEEPLTWYAGSKQITEFSDPEAAANRLTGYSSYDYTAK